MFNVFDLKNSFCRLLSDLKFSFFTIFTMAISIAVSLFLFAQIYTIKYKPLPFVDGGEIVILARQENGFNYTYGGLHSFDTHFFQNRQTSLDDFGFFDSRSLTISTPQFTEQFDAAATSSKLFSLADDHAIIGRTFVASDDARDAPRVVVINSRIWKQYFGGEDSVVGKEVIVDGSPATIVGVVDEAFGFPINHEVWLSYYPPNDPTPDGAGWNTGFGRLKPGVSLAHAEDEFYNLAASLEREHNNIYKGKSISLRKYTDAFSEPVTTPIIIMIAVSLSIILMGCLSISNLITVRVIENSRETHIKQALGIPIINIIATPVLESLWLCLIATGIGLTLFLIAVSFFQGAVIEGPFWWALGIDRVVILTGLLLALVIWILTATIAIVQVMSQPTNAVLAGGSKGGPGTKNSPLMASLVALQVACAFVLMVFTSLSVISLLKILNADYGVATHNFITANIRLPESRYTTLESRVDYYDKLRQLVFQLPQIKGLAFTGALPGSHGYIGNFSSLEHDMSNGGVYPKLIEMPASDNLFSLMEVELLEGREFLSTDDHQSTPVAIINENMANRLWPTSSAIGKKFQLNPVDNGPLLTVVGVIPNIVHGPPISFYEPEVETLYRPMRQVMPGWWPMQLIAKTSSNPYLVTQELKQISRNIDPQIAIADLVSFQDRLDRNTGIFKSLSLNFVPASILALLMAAICIYGISARAIMQSTGEIGIMKAFGFTDSQISKIFVTKSWKQIVFGLVPGLAILFWLYPVISVQLATSDVQSFILVSFIVSLILAFLVLAASYLPLIKFHKLSPKETIYYSE